MDAQTPDESNGSREATSNTDHQTTDPSSILKNLSANPELYHKTPSTRSIGWNDDTGGPLVEIHLKEELYYSVHSCDKEIMRRQHRRTGGRNDLGFDLKRSGRRCCLLS